MIIMSTSRLDIHQILISAERYVIPLISGVLIEIEDRLFSNGFSSSNFEPLIIVACIQMDL